MSLNILNITFLSLLRKLDIDIDQFPDKSFDGLFETKHNDLNYFLEWLVDNITSENVLTETELDLYNAYKNCVWATDEELDVIVTKCVPSYDELELLDENYVNLLSSELKELTKECQQLESVGCELETKHSELKKKPNNLKEECNKWRKRLKQVKEEIHIVNSGFSSVEKDIGFFKLHCANDITFIQKFKSLCGEEDQLIQKFKIKNMDETLTFPVELDNNVDLSQSLSKLSHLKNAFRISKFLFIISKGLYEEIQNKVLKAEEFLCKLKDESEGYFTFDDSLGIICGSNEVDSCSYLKGEVNLFSNNISKNIERECDLLQHKFLSQYMYYSSVGYENQTATFTEFLNYIKFEMASNFLILKFINKTIANEKGIADLIDKFCFLMDEDKNKIKNYIGTLTWKNKRSPEYHQQLNEKHALLFSYKQMKLTNKAKPEEKLILLNKTSENVKSLLIGSSFFPELFYTKLDETISSSLSDLSKGPTSKIQMAPTTFYLEFNKCEKFLSEYSHLIQRLLTEYLNVKESMSSNERRKQVLWIDFLTNQKVTAAGLENIHEDTN